MTIWGLLTSARKLKNSFDSTMSGLPARESCSVTATLSSESQWPPRNTGSFWSNFCAAAPQVQFHPPGESQSKVVAEQGYSQLLRVVETPDRLLSETVEASPASALRSGNLQSRRYGTALHRGLELLALQDPLPSECPAQYREP